MCSFSQIFALKFGSSSSCIFPRVLVEYNHHTDIELELVESLVYNGTPYLSFFPAESDEEEPGLIILKVIEENGEELLSTPDTDEELNEVYDRFMEQLFAEEEDSDD